MFKNWNYKKHAKVMTGIYLTCYALEMTIGYLLVKKTFDKDGKVIR